jgi:hypothetical protein
VQRIADELLAFVPITQTGKRGHTGIDFIE